MLLIFNQALTLLNQKRLHFLSELPSLPTHFTSLAEELCVPEEGRKTFLASECIFFPFSTLQKGFFFHPRNFLRVSLSCFYFNRPKVFPWSLFVLFCCLGQAFPVECSHKSISWWKDVCLEWTGETTEGINSSAFETNDCPQKPSAAQQHLSQIPNTCISS